MIAQVLAEEILADCSRNRQSAKMNSPPKFPAIRYLGHSYVFNIRPSYTLVQGAGKQSV